MSASTADPAIAAAFRRPFAEQLEFFRSKLGDLVPTQRWTDVWKEQHDRAFMVAGAAKADLLADLARAVDGAIADGKSIEWFRAQFDGIIERHGWSYRGPRNWRTRVIYATNAATSYAAGRLAQLKEGGFALWVYKHSDSVLHPRPLHLAWDGLALPADHPWWRTHYPPNAWGCKCYVVGARDAAGARRLGGDPDKPLDPAWLETGPNGEPPGIDRGWGYMPGATADVVREIERKAAVLPAPLAQALSDEMEVQRAAEWVVAQGIREGGSIEYAAVVRQGRVLLRKRGGVSHVAFEDSEIALMRDAIIVHNHPSSVSLSRGDLRLAKQAGAREVVAIGHDGSQYRGRALSLDDLDRYYDVADRHTRNRVNAMLRNGAVSIETANRWHDHAINTGLANAGVIEYRASSLPEVPIWIEEVADAIAEAIAALRRIAGRG